MTFHLFMFALIVGTTIWVGIDSSNLGMNRGRLGGGLLDMSVASWVICCVLVWIIAFPCYLVARSKYRRLNSTPFSHANGVPMWGLPPHQYSGAYGGPALVPSVPISPDGRWWWNGQQWIPMA